MGFTWKTVGHAFASAFKEIYVVSRKVQTALGGVKNEEKIVEVLTGLVCPGAVVIEQLAFGALGELIAAVHGVGDAAGANGLNISYDATVVAEIRQLLKDFPLVVAQVEAVFAKTPPVAPPTLKGS